MPDAVPAISIEPRQVALNVPDPVLPDRFVTVHLKFVHAFDPGELDADVHEPCSACTPNPGDVGEFDPHAALSIAASAAHPSHLQFTSHHPSGWEASARSQCKASSYNDRMAILKVARMGHPVLRAVAKAIPPSEIASPRVQRLIDDMFETMTEYAGIGLAGPQVHEPLRIFVAGVREAEMSSEVSDDRDMPFMVVINPEITAVGSATDEDWEGCLSVPDIRGRVIRPAAVQLSAYDREGRKVRVTATGLPARVIQHEADHLDGILFFDRMRSFESLTFMDEFRRHWAKQDDE